MRQRPCWACDGLCQRHVDCLVVVFVIVVGDVGCAKPEYKDFEDHRKEREGVGRGWSDAVVKDGRSLVRQFAGGA